MVLDHPHVDNFSHVCLLGLGEVGIDGLQDAYITLPDPANNLVEVLELVLASVAVDNLLLQLQVLLLLLLDLSIGVRLFLLQGYYMLQQSQGYVQQLGVSVTDEGHGVVLE